MKCVIDASMLANFVLPDEPNLLSDEYQDAMVKEGSTGPLMLQIELVNILIMSARRKRIAAEEIEYFLERSDQLGISFQPELTRLQRTSVIELAWKHQLTAYDASYLELARRLKIPLATGDKQLINAAPLEGVDLVLQS